MDISERAAQTQQRFLELQAKRNGLVQEANDMLNEMNKLEGEWNVLQELIKEQEPNTDATTIEAVPEITNEEEKKDA